MWQFHSILLIRFRIKKRKKNQVSLIREGTKDTEANIQAIMAEVRDLDIKKKNQVRSLVIKIMIKENSMLTTIPKTTKL